MVQYNQSTLFFTLIFFCAHHNIHPPTWTVCTEKLHTSVLVHLAEVHLSAVLSSTVFSLFCSWRRLGRCGCDNKGECKCVYVWICVYVCLKERETKRENQSQYMACQVQSEKKTRLRQQCLAAPMSSICSGKFKCFLAVQHCRSLLRGYAFLFVSLLLTFIACSLFLSFLLPSFSSLYDSNKKSYVILSYQTELSD